MLFEPETLLFLARKSGLTLRRKGRQVLITSAHPIPAAWAEAIKQHKAEMLPLLPDVAARHGRPPSPAGEIPAGQTYDLFGPVPEQAKRKRPKAKPMDASRPAKAEACAHG